MENEIVRGEGIGTFRMGFLLNRVSSAQLLELVQASETSPEEIIAKAIYTMWNFNRKQDNGK